MKVVRMSQEQSHRIETTHGKLLEWLWDSGLIDGHGSASGKLGIGEVYVKEQEVFSVQKEKTNTSVRKI